MTYQATATPSRAKRPTTKETETMTHTDLIAKISTRDIGRKSAWRDGVRNYMYELAESIEDITTLPTTRREINAVLLNGADDWSAYSWGGCSYIYNSDIAEALCSPSELRTKRGGDLPPNSREEWLDVQARALSQAARYLINIILEEQK